MSSLFQLPIDKLLVLTAICRGKSASITISDALNSLSPDDIDRMVKEAEELAAEDAAQRRHVEKLNELSTFIWQLRSHITDTQGLGGRLSNDDKQMLQQELKQASDWVEQFGPTATTEEIEERLAEVQAVVNPITTALYGGAGFQEAPSYSDDQSWDSYRHVEL